MYKIRILFVLLLSLISCSYSNSPNDKKKLILNKIDKEIILDGKIDDAWALADSVSDFFQLSPYYNQKPKYYTVAKVLTTETDIYCLMVNYQDRSEIEAINGVHDDYTGDAVSVMFDTFNDKRTAYKFAVSASGVKHDVRLLDDARNRDHNWDGIWFSEAKIYDWGYVVEMKIPYKSIQYDETINEWGLDFDRWVPFNNEDLYWCEYSENEGQRISKFGKLIFQDYHPNIKGLNLEIYPVAISKATLLHDSKYKIDPNAGLDIFYNPSQKLTFQLTANPDFAQIEADPYDFNISRYESYFDEKRPFFTQGNEVFNPSGRMSNSGFYRPLDLFYSRRIGKKLVDGTEVPLSFGTKVFGRLSDWEYGGFLAQTAETGYTDDDNIKQVEPASFFALARVKRQIFGNSSIGVFYLGKFNKVENSGVLDIDGAIRSSDVQFSYQLARSFKNDKGGFAGSFGYYQVMEDWAILARGRYIEDKFDIDQVGYVPWKGTSSLVGLTGPRWYITDGAIREIFLYFGTSAYYEKVDDFVDYTGFIGLNLNFRSNWGCEANYNFGKSKDSDIKYSNYEINFSSWFNTSTKYSFNFYGGYAYTYNFDREYLADYMWVGSNISYKPLKSIDIGTSANVYIEKKPDGSIEDITYNARPYFSITPINDLNIRMYADNLFTKSSQKLEQVIIGLLFSYNFLPKSWIYLAVNEVKNRNEVLDAFGNPLPVKMRTKERAAVIKIKYMYYF